MNKPTILSFSEARAKLKALMDQVTADRAPAVITRRGAEPVVMVSLSEWDSLQETQHLLSSPANAKRLRESVAAADAGEVRALTQSDLEALLGAAK
ncbi:MAG: type II toxin-antitoxin system prevent-host-death family antitoxin [Oceanicaulis sp.]